MMMNLLISNKFQRHQRFAELAQYLKKKREARGLTQLDVAKALNYASSQFVSNWERGLCSPPMNSLSKIAAVLDIKKDKLIKLLLKIAKAEMEETFQKQGSSGKPTHISTSTR